MSFVASEHETEDQLIFNQVLHSCFGVLEGVSGTVPWQRAGNSC